MKILFIGTVKFSYDALETLINNGSNIVAVITKAESGFNADYADLSILCKQHGIPYKLVRDINHERNADFIRSFSPDVIYCFGWSQLIKQEIIEIPKIGSIGFHPAELPYNRGRHPIIWALALGLDKTASTFFFIDEGSDTGDIISQQQVEIKYKDNADSLYRSITSVALKQIIQITNSLQSNSYIRKKQDSLSGNYWRKRNKLDGQIDFRMSSRSIYNLVRSLAKPYVGAHILLQNGEEIKIWKVEEITTDENNIEPGKIMYSDSKSIKIKCGEGAINIIDHEFVYVPKIGSYL